jgi:hypothetical protein
VESLDISGRVRKNGAGCGLVCAFSAISIALSGCALETVEGLGSRFVTAAKAAFRDPDDGVTYHVHRVQPGETLQGIAKRYRVRVSGITHLNRMGLSREIEVGQRLLIPRNATLPRVASSPPRNAPAPAPKPTAPSAPVEVRPDPRLDHSRTLVDEAVAEYRAARFESSLSRARKAEDLLRDLDGNVDARRLSARAAFVAGSSHAARGENERAVESFARVRKLDPGFEPPRGWLSPRLEALYAESQPD